MVAKSPDRNTFQLKNYIKRQQEKNELLDEHYLNFFESLREQEEKNLLDPKWQNNNMEYDLRTTDWILEKVRASDKYAQNLYAAICNNDFIKNEVWPILKDEYWSCSWRHAGGIIADMREKGDYIDWYCSGMGEGLGNGDETGDKGYVPESHVTDEIKEDLHKLGWIVTDNK